MEKLTLEWVISELEKDGKGSKQNVLKRLKKASVEDLMELKYSIQRQANYLIANGKRGD